MSDWVTIYDCSVDEPALRPTGILDGRGRMIYTKPVVGFTRPLREYVVKEDDHAEARASTEVEDGRGEGAV